MRDARERAKLEAIEQGYAVHVHVCFGEVVNGFCQACELHVPDDVVATPWADLQDYKRDVAALLSRIDGLEEQIAELEDSVFKPSKMQRLQARLRIRHLRDQGPDHYDEIVDSLRSKTKQT